MSEFLTEVLLSRFGSTKGHKLQTRAHPTSELLEGSTVAQPKNGADDVSTDVSVVSGARGAGFVTVTVAVLLKMIVTRARRRGAPSGGPQGFPGRGPNGLGPLPILQRVGDEGFKIA